MTRTFRASCPARWRRSKNSDFQQRSLLYGPPPKIGWLRLGNCTRQQLVSVITAHEQDMRAFDDDPFGTVLVLS